MMPITLWLAALAAAPLAVVVGLALGMEAGELRRLAAISAGAMCAIAAALFVVPELRTFHIPWPGAPHPLLGGSILRSDAFSSALIPLPAALWLLTVAVTPHSRLDRTGLQRTALATLTTTLAFLTESPALLALLWTASVAMFWAALSSPDARRARRVAGAYLAVATVLLPIGIVLVTTAAGSRGEWLGLWLIIAAALIRKGIFPFHAWVPEVFDRGRLGPAILFSAPQMGSYVVAVLIVPRASAETLRVVAILSLVTAVYGAALTLFQRDARRACGYLFVSQSALVLAGLDCTGVEALGGALVLWISSALAFAGVARCVLVLEARRGRLDLTTHHGGYEQMPLLAASFLVLGMPCTGFPGTLGFVGEELLVEGAVGAFPILGFFVVAAVALTGLAVLRMYFSLFCGAPGISVQLRLRRREAVVFGAAAAFLVVTGLAPGPIVASRLAASHTLLAQRTAFVTP
jgi:NADH-quinone oxidoreductase subunit M